MVRTIAAAFATAAVLALGGLTTGARPATADDVRGQRENLPGGKFRCWNLFCNPAAQLCCYVGS